MIGRTIIGSLLVLLFSVLTVAVTPEPAKTDTIVNGTVEDGYTYRDNYWWYYNNPYTRVRVTTPGYSYYSCGRYYQAAPTYSYTYTLYTGTVTPAYVAPVVPSYTDPGWRGKLLDIAKQRDKGELDIRRLTAEQSAYIESLNALGLTGNFRIDGYGQAMQYPSARYGGGGYGYNYNLGNYGANGNTLYGYSYQSIKEAYGETNMNALFQQASRHTSAAQALAGQAHTEFSDLVAAAGTNQARIAEIFAKAAAAEKVLRAAEPQPSSKTTIIKSGTVVVPGQPNPPNDQMPPADDPGVQESINFLKTTAVPLCGKCHTGAEAKGKFDIASYPNLTQAQKSVVWDRLTTQDGEKVMPRTADNKPARLNAAQLREFFTH